MTATVCVTGAGGFVGGFVARWLAAKDFRVIATVRRAADAGPALPNVSWQVTDLAMPILPSRFDALVHCAAVLPAHCPDPQLLYRNNLQPCRQLIDIAPAAGVRSVVFLSSMSVYGRIEVPVVVEDTNPLDPDPYGRAKRDGEDLLEMATGRGLYSGIAIRLPGVVGKGSHHNFLSDAITRVLRDEPIAIANPDAPFNNIVYVGDLARFIEQWLKEPRQGYSVTNLAAREPISIFEMASHLCACAGKASHIELIAARKPPFTIALERALLLGYRPATVRESVASFVRDVTAAV